MSMYIFLSSELPDLYNFCHDTQNINKSNFTNIETSVKTISEILRLTLRD